MNLAIAITLSPLQSEGLKSLATRSGWTGTVEEYAAEMVRKAVDVESRRILIGKVQSFPQAKLEAVAQIAEADVAQLAAAKAELPEAIATPFVPAVKLQPEALPTK